MEVDARPATRADLGGLRELCEAALQALSTSRGGPLRRSELAVADQVDGLLSAALSDPQRLLLVGTIDLNPVAVGSARAAGSLGVIDGVYVHPGARGVGVGERLIGDILGWCAGKGCSGVDSTALPGDRETKSLLERSGFKARLIVFHREAGT